MDFLGKDTVWVLSAAVLALVTLVGELVRRLLKRGNGSQEDEKEERRIGQGEILGKLTQVESKAESNAQRIEGMQQEFRAIHRRFDALEERERKGDTQTARELGEIRGTLESMTRIIAGRADLRGSN